MAQVPWNDATELSPAPLYLVRMADGTEQFARFTCRWEALNGQPLAGADSGNSVFDTGLVGGG